MNAKTTKLYPVDGMDDDGMSVPGDSADSDSYNGFCGDYSAGDDISDEDALNYIADEDDLYGDDEDASDDDDTDMVDASQRNGQESDPLSAVGTGDLGGPADLRSDEELGRMGLWELVDAGGLGDGWADASVDMVGDEVDPRRPHYSDAELDFASQSYLSNPRKARRRRRIGIYIPTFTEDDFEAGPQREAYLLLRDNVRACYLTNPGDRDREFALRWVFEGDESTPFSFDLCCRVLSADPQVIRTRLQYEFYLRWKVASAPFNNFAAPLPERLYSHAWFAAGSDGVLLAALVWSWPGVDADRLYERAIMQKRFDEPKFMSLLERLDERGVLQSHGDNWYATGRGGRDGFF